MPETLASLVTRDGQVTRTATGSSVAKALEQLEVKPDPNHWVWLLSSEAEALPGALASLLALANRSSEVTGIIGPKLVSKSNAREITQLGLTLTPLGEPFSPVSNEFDQGQRDSLGDVLAVGQVGMLIRSTLIEQLGGFDENAPLLAADIDFSLRARLAGYRVVVEPSAKVAFDGQTSSLGKQSKAQLRRATIHLRMVYSPLWLVLLYWFALPANGVLRAVLRIAQKRPDRIWAELSSAFWGFFTLPKRLASRALVSSADRKKFSSLRSLRASWSEVRIKARAHADQAESEQNLAAFDRQELGEPAKNFTASLGWLVALLLLIVSWRTFPVSVSITGDNVLPLSEQLGQLFARAGASWQPIGNGFFAPSDPFNWVLLLMGSLTFWSPQLSIGLLLFLAHALAFSGAWRVLGLVTKKPWVRTIAGLAYALWPSLTIAISKAEIPAVVSAVALPWLVLAIARAAGLGRAATSRSNTQTWSWVGLSGLLLAVVGASAPSLLPLILIALAVVASMRIRRFGYLFWIPLPLGAIFAPYAFFFIARLGEPLGVLADPGVRTSAVSLSNLELLLGGSIMSTVVLFFAIVAVLTKRWLPSLCLWISWLILVAAAWLAQQLLFPAAGVVGATSAELPGSPLTLLAAAALVSAFLVAIFLDALNRRWFMRLVASLILLAGVLPLGYLTFTQPNEFKASDGRVVPWLLYSQASSDAQLLEVSASGETYSVRWHPVRGTHFEDSSSIYRFALAERIDSPEYRGVAELVANMVSANGVDISSQLKAARVQYVMVPVGETPALLELGSALDSVPQLESAGVTEFGRLWRVRGAETLPLTEHSVWSITKLVQVSVLGAFILLALPSRSKRRTEASEIFVEGEE